MSDVIISVPVTSLESGQEAGYGILLYSDR